MRNKPATSQEFRATKGEVEARAVDSIRMILDCVTRRRKKVVMKRRKLVSSSASVDKAFPVREKDFHTSTKTSPFVNCVQVAIKSRGVAVRDSKDSGRKTLYFNHTEWKAFIDGVKLGEFDT